MLFFSDVRFPSLISVIMPPGTRTSIVRRLLADAVQAVRKTGLTDAEEERFGAAESYVRYALNNNTRIGSRGRIIYSGFVFMDGAMLDIDIDFECPPPTPIASDLIVKIDYSFVGLKRINGLVYAE